MVKNTLSLILALFLLINPALAQPTLAELQKEYGNLKIRMYAAGKNKDFKTAQGIRAQMKALGQQIKLLKAGNKP